MLKPTLNFIEDTHTYLWNGEKVPSVTQVLNSWVKVNMGRGYYVHTITGATVDAEVFESSGDFGTAIHEAAKYILTEGLDWDALDPALVPPLREFEKWLADYQVKPLHIEEPMYSEKHGVAGTPDFIGEIRGFRHLSIIDIKTGLDNPMCGPQTAGYEIIFRDQEKYRRPILRHELILPRDGSPYKFNPLTNSQDGAFFLARLFQHRYLNS